MFLSDTNIKKEKKDGLYITLLQHWIYSCFKNQELLNENIDIEVIKKWYFLKDINYLLEKRATKMDYVFRLLENINFCKLMDFANSKHFFLLTNDANFLSSEPYVSLGYFSTLSFIIFLTLFISNLKLLVLFFLYH